jgi:hypothetical protein
MYYRNILREVRGGQRDAWGAHKLQLLAMFKIAKYLVASQLCAELVKAGSYQDDALWMYREARGKHFGWSIERDGTSGFAGLRVVARGQARPSRQRHLLSQAQAFLAWLHRYNPPELGSSLSLPPEDFWEFVARGSAGMIRRWTMPSTLSDAIRRNVESERPAQ